MKKVLIGIAAGIAIGYTIRKCQEKKFFEKMNHNIGLLSLKVRRRFQNNRDISKNEVEYIGDFINDEELKPNDKNDGILNEISY